MRFPTFISIVFAALLAIVSPAPAADDAPAKLPAIVYPPDGVAVASELVLVMAVAPAADPPPPVTLDDKPLEAERLAFSPAWIARGARLYPATRPAESHSQRTALLADKSNKVVLIAVAKLTPGSHTLAAGSARITILRAEGPDVPARQLFHTHEKIKIPAHATACSDCHELRKSDIGRLIGPAKTPATCQRCHEDTDVQLIHRHVLDPLANCQTCHDPHGSPRPKLLTDTPEKLCTQCHEGGHSKR